MKNKEIVALILSVVLAITVGILILYNPCPTEIQRRYIQVLMSVFSGLMAFYFSGKIRIERKIKDYLIMSTSGFSIFVVVYLLNPAIGLHRDDCTELVGTFLVTIDGKHVPGVKLNIPGASFEGTSDRDGRINYRFSQSMIPEILSLEFHYELYNIDSVLFNYKLKGNTEIINLNRKNKPNDEFAAYFEKWKKENKELVNEHRLQDASIKYENIFQQIFSAGRILVSQSGWSCVIIDNQYYKTVDPLKLITKKNGTNWDINYPVLEELLLNIPNKDRRNIYRDYVTRGLIVGGIGTIYVTDDLYPKLSDPLTKSDPDAYERLYQNCLSVTANDGFQCIIGLPNINDKDRWYCNLLFFPDWQIKTKGRVSKVTASVFGDL